MPRFSTFMGRKQVRSSVQYGASQHALNRQFQASMNDVLGNFRHFINSLEGVAPDILIEAVEPTHRKSIGYAPIKDGDLRASAYLAARTFRGGAEVEVGFGRGGHPDYAIYVHEMPYAHADPTRSQFLRAALDEDIPSIVSALPRLIRGWAGT
jgi:hypothetical protein